MVSILSCLAYFAQHKMFFEIHPRGMYQYFTSFYHQVVFAYMNIPLLVYLFTCCWTLSFQFGRIKWFWRWIVLMVAQHSKCASVHSVTQSCLTLCNPMDSSMPGFPVHPQLPELAQTHVHQVGDAIQPSHPRSSPSPAFNLSHYQGLFQ